MSQGYRRVLDQLRQAFPRPHSDPANDANLIRLIQQALHAVDQMKSQLPLLGRVDPPFDYDAAQRAQLHAEPRPAEQVTAELASTLNGMPLFGHPHTQLNVHAQPTFPSLVGVLLAALINPNLCWDESSKRVALAEVETISMTARLVGYDPVRAGGAFTFGGTGTLMYGVKAGLEKACPRTMARGLTASPVLFASEAAHCCCHSVAGWLGLGTDNVCLVPTDERSEMDLTALERAMRQALDAGRPIAAIVATMGSTDAFGLDDLEGIAALRDRLADEYALAYRPHVHADAVIGWAWSTFNDYAFEANPLGFRGRTLAALAGVRRRIMHLAEADSVGVDFHKTGFAPYISSAVLFQDAGDLEDLRRDDARMPYLYHHGDYRPGLFTLETSRAGTGVLAALANLRLFGLQGLQALLGHLVEMAELLREQLKAQAGIAVLNEGHHGPVTIFRVAPPAHSPEASEKQPLRAYNEYNRRLYAYLRDEALAGRGAMLSLTEGYRRTACNQPMVGLKAFLLSPFVDETHVRTVVEKVLEARERVAWP